MSNNMKKILTAILAVALVVTTVLPGSDPVYAEEKPTVTAETVEDDQQAATVEDAMDDEEFSPYPGMPVIFPHDAFYTLVIHRRLSYLLSLEIQLRCDLSYPINGFALIVNFSDLF